MIERTAPWQRGAVFLCPMFLWDNGTAVERLENQWGQIEILLPLIINVLSEHRDFNADKSDACSGNKTVKCVLNSPIPLILSLAITTFTDAKL